MHLPYPASLLTIVWAFALSATAAAAPISTKVSEAAADLRQRAATESNAYEIVASLTSKVGPRLAGSRGDQRAVKWALEMLRAEGFENVRAEAVTVPHWERGSLSVALGGASEQPLIAESLGGSVGTSDAGVNASVVRLRSVEALNDADDSLIRGRIVYLDDRMERHRTGKGYGKTVMNRVAGPSAAARKGALALVIRSVGTDSNRIGHTGSTRYGDDAPKIPAIALANPDADILDYLFDAGLPVELKITSTARHVGTAISANVIGERVGTSRKNEIILLGAHLDSWDLGTGAIDDGAGVAIVTAAARLAGNTEPKIRRTIRVVLYANEEFGLSGARAYAAQYADTIEKHIVGMESDFGAGKVWRLSSRVADTSLPVIDALHALLSPLGIERGENSASGGADLSPLRAAGMPVMSLDQDGTDYFDYHHTLNDTLDKIDRADLDQNVAAMAVTAYVLASVKADLGRLAVAE